MHTSYEDKKFRVQNVHMNVVHINEVHNDLEH